MTEQGGAAAPHDFDVVSSTPVFGGRVWSVHRDLVAMPDGETGIREVVVHPGAVAVVALRGTGAETEVLLVTQYRHPVRRRLDELPAGLLDVDGEPALAAAQRELAEEAGYAAARWDVLLDLLTSPGFTDEAVRIFLARDVSPCERDVQGHEEAEMSARWLPLAAAVQAALAGELENASAVSGVLAASQALASGAVALRPADAPWSSRPRGSGTN